MEIEIRLINKAVMILSPWAEETKEDFYKRLEALLDICNEMEDRKHFEKEKPDVEGSH